MVTSKRLPDTTDFDLRLLRVFKAVAMAGSFTAAEVLLNKSKSSISMDISALESRLGLILCRRGRGGFALTAQGKEIFALSVDLFKNLTQFRDRVSDVASRVRGEFQVAMDDNFPVNAQEELSGILRTFSAAYPDLFLGLRTTSPEHVIKLVLDGSADVGISAVPKNVPELTLISLFEERMVLFCGAKHPLFDTADSQIDAELVCQYDCVDVVARQNSKACEVMQRMRIKARSNTVHSRILFVLTGRFLGFLPLDFARPWIDLGEIRPLVVESLSYVNTCSAIARRDAAPNAAHYRFLDELKKAFDTRDVRKIRTRTPGTKASNLVGA